MKLSTRVTVLATMLVAPMLGGLWYAARRARRADLEADLAREAREVAEALRAGIEPLSADAAVATLTERAWRAREHDAAFQLETLRAPDRDGRSWQTSDPGWLVLLQAAEQDDGPVSRFFERADGTRAFAMAVPLYDEASLSLPRQHPARRPVAVLGVKRSTDYIRQAVRATALRMFPLFLAVVVFLAVGVLLALRSGVTSPLKRLRQSEKLATIGQMAAEIAHEVGTPLNVIGGRARALEKKAGDPAELTKNIEIIQTQVGRITKIIKQVLDFSRKRGPTVTRVDLARVGGEALDAVGETIRRQGIATELRSPTALAPVPGDPDQIQQVCLNLLMNAIHAMPAGAGMAW